MEAMLGISRVLYCLNLIDSRPHLFRAPSCPAEVGPAAVRADSTKAAESSGDWQPAVAEELASLAEIESNNPRVSSDRASEEGSRIYALPGDVAPLEAEPAEELVQSAVSGSLVGCAIVRKSASGQLGEAGIGGACREVFRARGAPEVAGADFVVVDCDPGGSGPS